MSSSTSALAGGYAQGALEGVGHAADDDQRVDLVEQVIDHVDLAGDLGAADDGDEGLFRRFQRFAEIGDLLFHQQAGDGGLEEVGDAFCRGVGAVGGAEGVVDVDVGQRGEGLRERRIVGLFFGVVAQILKQQHLAGFELARHLAGHFADAVRRKGDVDGFAQLLVEQLAQADDHRAQRVLGIRLALGAAQMRGEDDLGLVAQGVDDGGQRGHDAGVVGDGRSRLR